MARSDTAAQLFAYGVVDVEYQRIPCTYNGGKIQIKVHEDSRFPSYLAFVILYHPDKTEILTVEIWKVIIYKINSCVSIQLTHINKSN